MTRQEEAFLSELDLFRGECEASSQFLYAYLAIHHVAKKRKAVFRALDRHALFWNTVAGALQASAIVALGRVFDQGTPHNVDALLGLAQKAPTMFSKSALAQRKQGSSAAAPPWLGDFMAGVQEPTASTFRGLRTHVKKLRRVYELRYRDLRHKVFAHTIASRPTEVGPIAERANINELKRLVSSLLSLHQALFDLFWNGRSPALPRVRYSGKPRKGLTAQARPHERIVTEVEEVLVAAARPDKRTRSAQAMEPFR
jgi:hypothetical protein